MDRSTAYVAFSGSRRIAAGALRDVLPVLKQRLDEDPSDMVLVFDVETGSQTDFDLRGTLEEVFAREVLGRAQGPGRPKLGVTSREVSLLPRHWGWLEDQPNGASATIRRLVEAAMKQAPGEEQARRVRAALSRVLSAMAGNRPHFEEAMRALFAGDTSTFETLVKRWPKDIREYAMQRAHEAARLQGASEGSGQ